MANIIVMPKLGLTMKEGVIAKWYKKVGDPVETGEKLFEVTTDKLTNEVESSCSGIVLNICAGEGDAVECLEPVAYVGEAGETLGTVNNNSAKTEEAKAAADKEKNKDVTVAVIGGGPGGYVAAIRAAQLGAKVTLIEKDKIGGTCLNVGCIPTKALLHSAELYTEAQKGSEFGINAVGVTVDWKKVQSNKNSVSKGLAQGVSALLRANKVNVREGAAEFIDSTKLKVVKQDGSEEIVEADKIIIASGSIPAVPPIPGIDNKNCVTSTGALSFEEIPKSLVVIGGGVIGIELASAYKAFGTKVTVIEMLPKLLPMMDGELTEILKNKLVDSGIEIFTEARVLAVEEATAGAKVKVGLNGEEKYFEAEKVLVAVGRRTDTAGLKLENAGIANDRGRITVNNRQQTNVENIYAIGDCIGKVMLAHVASVQGEVAAENAAGIEAEYDEKTNPSCVYTNPEFAGVGMTEEKVMEKNIEYVVGKFPMAANGKSKIMGCKDGMIKIIADAKYKEILGVHILGPRATDLITEGALAIRLEATAQELISTIHAHPTVGEAIHEAALAVENRAIHIRNK
ncbi:MAG: dihydrolipoyl dehydrogenase [Clostridiaceae bacterium]